MAIDQLFIDLTDSNTIADSHQVGSVLLDSSKAVITAGDGNSDNLSPTALNGIDTRSFLYGYDATGDNWDRLQIKAGLLQVEISAPLVIDVALDGVYNVGSNATPDHAGMILNTRAATLDDTTQAERITAGAWATVAAAGISNINAMDVNAFMYGIDGTSGDAVSLTIDNTTGGVDVNIVGSSSLNVNDAALANTAIANGATLLTAANTAESAVGTALTDRKYLMLYNKDNRKMFVGGAGVSSTNGFPVSPGSYIEMRAGAAVDVQFVSAKTGHDTRYLELS